jgi:hypothetical protein
MKVRHKFATVAMLAMLLVGSLFVGVSGAAAVTYNGSLAGRPIDGNAASTCQGLAYGRVNGLVVLFTAAHCAGAGGTVVNGPNGRLGTWMADVGGAAHDLAAILLDYGNYPSNKNQIFRGNGGQWWTITQAIPSANIGCVGLAGRFGNTIYQNFNHSLVSDDTWRDGHDTSFYSHASDYSSCLINTDIVYHSLYKDSGSSFLMYGYTNQVLGIATLRNGSNLVFTPAFEGITALNNYWKSHGSAQGAHFCYSASCP